MPVNVASIASFLTDCYAGATLLLVPLWVATKLISQPSRRMALSWAATGGLLWLAIVCALPTGPRISLWSTAIESSATDIEASTDSAALPTKRFDKQHVESPGLAAHQSPHAPADATLADAPLQPAGRITVETPIAAWWRAVSWQTVSWRALAVGAYCAGAAGMLLWQMLGAVRAAVVCRRARAAEPDLHAQLVRIISGSGDVPRLLIDGKLPSAAAIGIWRPTILLPEWLVRAADESGMAALLAHEWTHIHRRDLWLLACTRALSVVLYLHPLYWWLRREIQDDQELLADAAAARVLGPTCYAQQLLAWSRAAGRPRFRLAMSVGLWERPSRLSRRIRTLIDERAQTALACSRRWQLGAACGVGLLAVGLSLVTLRPEVSTAAEPQKQAKAAASPLQPTAAAAPAEVTKTPAGETYAIDGRVLGPDGEPFAGAKLYAVIKSAEERPVKLKDPTAKPPFELMERDGQSPQLRAVHPRVIEFLEKHGKGTVLAESDPFLQSPETQSELGKIIADMYEGPPPFALPVRAISGADGRFRFEIPKSDVVEPLEQDVTLVADAPPLGPAWTLSHEPGSLAGVELRLAEDLQVRGRIVDSQGRPVARAIVQMGAIMASPEGTIDFWKELVAAYMPDLDPRHTPRSFIKLQTRALSYILPSFRLRLFPRQFVTDSDGRFTIQGVGANRAVYRLNVSAPNSGGDEFSVITVADSGIPTPADTQWGQFRPEFRTYGANFEHKLRQQQIIEGTVRDAATGKPVPNVQMAAWSPAYADAFTDAEGKYRLLGLSRADSYRVFASPWENRRSRQPYLSLTKTMDGTNATGPIVADFNLIRGVVLRGKLTDGAGKPLAGARVFYGAYPDKGRLDATFYPGNPNFPPKVKGVILAPFDVARFEQAHTQTADDGTYSMIVLPGRGVLGIFVGDQYATADEFSKDPQLNQFSGTVPRLQGFNFNAIEPLDVPDDAQEVRGDYSIELKPAPKVAPFE